MSRSDRWAYMSRPNYNPPNDDCPECVVPSKTYHQGAKTVDGVSTTSWACEHGHKWDVSEKRPVM